LSVCDNAFRVIKYVVLLGYKHSHYNLVDLRIHDINVIISLTMASLNASIYWNAAAQFVGP
jgi:hypothetical protein